MSQADILEAQQRAREFNLERMAEEQRAKQLRRINDAMKLLDRHPTPAELAAAQAVVDRAPNEPQGELKLGSAA